VPTDFQTDVQSTSNSQAQVDDRAQSKMKRKSKTCGLKKKVMKKNKHIEQKINSIEKSIIEELH